MVRNAIDNLIKEEYSNRWGDIFEYSQKERGMGIVDGIDHLFKTQFPDVQYSILNDDFEDTTHYATGTVFVAYVENGQLNTVSYRWVSF